MPYCIETNRLLLRQLEDSDLSGLIALLGNPTVTHWLFSGEPMDSQNAKSFIEKEFSFGEWPIGLGTLCEKSTVKIIGFAGFIPCGYLGNEDFEFGMALNEESWGKGYGKEIAEAQIKFGFAHLPVDRLLALAHPENVASLKVIEGVGMRFLKQVLTKERGSRCVYVIQKVGDDPNV